MPIYRNKIISPAKNNRVDKLFLLLKKSLKFNNQMTRPN